MSETIQATQTKKRSYMEPEGNGHDLAPAETAALPAPQESQGQSEALEGGALALWTRNALSIDNFDGDDKQKFMRRMICMNDAEKGGDHLNETILVKYWMVHEIEIVQEDGELVDCYRVVLITPEGKSYAFVSGVLAKGVREIFREYGREPLDPPLAVQVKQKATGKGRRCYTLVPVIEG